MDLSPWQRRRNGTFPPLFLRRLLSFVEAYLGLEMHRAGREGVLTCLLGRVPEEVGAGQPQKYHPGDLRDPRAWRPGGEGRRSRARCGSPTKSSSPGGFQPPHLRLCGDKGCFRKLGFFAFLCFLILSATSLHKRHLFQDGSPERMEYRCVPLGRPWAFHKQPVGGRVRPCGTPGTGWVGAPL